MLERDGILEHSSLFSAEGQRHLGVGGGHLVRGGEAEDVGGGGEEEDGGDRHQDRNLQAEVRLLIYLL